MKLTDRQIGLGTFPFSGVFSPISQEEAEGVVKEFVNMGGHYIETAPIYPRNNVDLSKLLALFNREDVFVGTKCVLSLDENGKQYSSGKSDALKRQCIDEIKRLGVDYLDLLEAHVTATDAPAEEVAGTLNELKKEGLVRYIGASNASLQDMRGYIDGGGVDFVQNRYSIIHRRPTESITMICEEHDIKFNPYQVIERGQLNNAAADAGEWREGDLRAQKAEYVGDAYERVHNWVRNVLGKIAGDAGMNLSELSIRWVLSKRQVTMPVIGATKVWQIKQNMSVAAEPLSKDVLSAVDAAYTSFSMEIDKIFGLSIEEFRGLV